MYVRSRRPSQTGRPARRAACVLLAVITDLAALAAPAGAGSIRYVAQQMAQILMTTIHTRDIGALRATCQATVATYFSGQIIKSDYEQLFEACRYGVGRNWSKARFVVLRFQRPPETGDGEPPAIAGSPTGPAMAYPSASSARKSGRTSPTMHDERAPGRGTAALK